MHEFSVSDRQIICFMTNFDNPCLIFSVIVRTTSYIVRTTQLAATPLRTTFSLNYSKFYLKLAE